MNRLRTYIIIWALLLGWGSGAAADDIVMHADASPRQVAMGQQIRLQVTIEGKVNLQGSPSLPDLQDFQVFSGGRSSNFSFVNGQISSSLNFTYILVPKQSGKFTIGPVQISYGGKVYTTQPIEIEVTGYGAAPSVPSAPSQPKTNQNLGRQSVPGGTAHAGEPVFITTSVDRQDVYVNQPVTLTFRFFSRIPILSQPQYQPPDTSGFWSEDLPPQREYVTQLAGHDYRVVEIKTALFPTSAGKLTIGQAQLVVQIQNFQRNIDPFADDFFRNFFSTGQQVPLRSQPISIRVKPLPEAGKPQDFSGTVGKWSISARLDQKEAKLGEAVTLEIRIFGEGNVKSVGKPDLPPLTGFKVYETISSSEVQKQGDRVRGVKIYRTLLRPEVTGMLKIPPISYNYYDPQTEKYEKIQIPSFSLNSLPGAAQPAMENLPTGSSSGSGVKIMAKDIRYLKLNVPLSPTSKDLPALFWILGFLLPPLGLLLLWAWQAWQDKLTADPQYARKIKADQIARQVLRKAHTARQHQDAKAFYAALAQTLMGYLADRLGASRSGVTQREILQQLQERGAGKDLLDKLSHLLDECDYARFAPGEREAKAMAQDEDTARELLAALMRVVTKEKKK